MKLQNFDEHNIDDYLGDLYPENYFYFKLSYFTQTIYNLPQIETVRFLGTRIKLYKGTNKKKSSLNGRAIKGGKGLGH